MTDTLNADARPTRGGPRRGPDPERFAEIVDAAAKLILEKGYAATSIQDIADSVGILKGSLYHYVRSKEDFLYAIISDVYATAIADIQEVQRIEAGALEKLAFFVRKHVRFTTEHLTAYTIRLQEFEQLSRSGSRASEREGRSYIEILRRILSDGVEEGVFDPALDVQLCATIILGQLNALTRWYNPAGKISPEHMADAFVGMIVSSVASNTAVRSKRGIERLRAQL